VLTSRYAAAVYAGEGGGSGGNVDDIVEYDGDGVDAMVDDDGVGALVVMVMGKGCGIALVMSDRCADADAHVEVVEDDVPNEDAGDERSVADRSENELWVRVCR
jgi:hypothetical protein